MPLEPRCYSLKSTERIMKIRDIILNLNRREYLPYNLVGVAGTPKIDQLV